MSKYKLEKSPYEMLNGTIAKTKNMTDAEKYFKIELDNDRILDHDPGQFVMVSIPGIGEAPISISSSPTQVGYFELVVRKVGKLTTALHNMDEGDRLGIRGPFGNGFPVQQLEGHDLVFIAGGLGVVPLRSLINYVIHNRRDFGDVHILFGCKCPEEILYTDELKMWEDRLDVNFNMTVDKGSPNWKGNVGLITTLIPKVKCDCEKTISVVCGPPIMYKFVLKELLKKDIPEKHIYLSLERHMKCGVGQCGHCQIGDKYCCKDGPVFCYDDIKDNIEAI